MGVITEKSVAIEYFNVSQEFSLNIICRLFLRERFQKVIDNERIGMK